MRMLKDIGIFLGAGFIGLLILLLSIVMWTASIVIPVIIIYFTLKYLGAVD